MALNIKDPETDRLARELAALTGQSITTALREALAAHITAVESRQRAGAPRRREILDEIATRGRARSVDDPRTPEEIVGYDDRGLPA